MLFSIFIISDNNLNNFSNPTKIILITIDGVRWMDLFDAREPVGNFNPSSREIAPNIYKHFVDNGMAIGKLSDAFVGGPAHISQPGYLEILRGRPTFDCFNNYCPQNIKPTIINEFPNDSAVFSGWETIAKIFDNSLAVVNINKDIRSDSWRKLNLPDNQNYPDDFGDEEYRADKYTQEAALDYLRIYQPTFTYLSFGDTDEWAHQNNMLFYLASINSVDEFIGEIFKIVDRNTIFIITTDHGRSSDFANHHWDEASRRVWIMIGGYGIPALGFVKYNRPVYLADIFPTIIEITKHKHSEKSLLNLK